VRSRIGLADTTCYFQQDYFQKTVAPVKKVLLVYGPNGQSRGIANVVFGNAASATKAVAELNGVKVDNRPMKVCKHGMREVELTRIGRGHRRWQRRPGAPGR
jgi:hypothetical protein